MTSEFEEEEWKTIPDHPNYEISSHGRIRSFRSGILKPFPFKKTEPYLAIDLMKNGKRTRRSMHRLVLEVFTGPPPTNRHEVRHMNGIGDDNHRSNLEWGTKKENQNDRIDHNTHLRGTNSPNSKLTSDDVLEIRRRRAEGEPAASILLDFPFITLDHIYHIQYRRTWKWLK